MTAQIELIITATRTIKKKTPVGGESFFGEFTTVTERGYADPIILVSHDQAEIVAKMYFPDAAIKWDDFDGGKWGVCVVNGIEYSFSTNERDVRTISDLPDLGFIKFVEKK